MPEFDEAEYFPSDKDHLPEVAMALWDKFIFTSLNPSHPLDGENLLPVCTGERAVHDRELFWRITGFDAARVGRWKYLKDASGEYLFDLSIDPGEKADCKRRESATFDRVKQLYLGWNAGMLPMPKPS